MKKWKWKKLQDNSVLISKEAEFYISFNPDTDASVGGMGKRINDLGNALTKGTPDELIRGGVPETALVKKSTDGNPFGNIYYILVGDFRKEYERIVEQGFDACLRFYESKPLYKSSWSTY